MFVRVACCLTSPRAGLRVASVTQSCTAPKQLLGAAEALRGCTRGLSTEVQRRDLEQLHASCKAGIVFDVYTLLETKRASWADADESGSTALHHAAAGKKDNVIAFLLSSGSSPTVKNKAGLTALECAIQSGNTAGFARLLDYLPPDCRTITPTALLEAVLRTAPPEAVPRFVASLLEKTDADPHAPASEGSGTIMTLAAAKYPGLTRQLKGHRRDEAMPSGDVTSV